MVLPISRLLTILLACTPSVALAAEFIPLGDLAGANFYSDAFAVTADGTVVVGQSHSSFGSEAFRWSIDTGMVGLGDLIGGDFVSVANGVSAGGLVVIGQGTTQVSALTIAVRWTDQIGPAPLGPVPQEGELFPVTHAYDTSSNGESIVGELLEGNDTVTSDEAVIWQANGAIQRLGYLHTGQSRRSYAQAVSDDGSVVVGSSSNLPIGEIYRVEEAFRWTEATGMIGLGNLANNPSRLSEATAVSPDGGVIAGMSESSTSPFQEPFAWTATTGMTRLITSDGANSFYVPTAVSEQGQNIVGYAKDVNAPGNAYVAWVWDEVNGIRPLQDVLSSDFGLAVNGWTLEFAKDITPDGRTIVGRGINPDGNVEAWVVRLDHPIGVPEPNTFLAGILGLYCIATMRRARL